MAAGVMDQAQMLREIRKIQADESLTDAEKAKRRQALLSGAWKQTGAASEDEKAQGAHERLFHLFTGHQASLRCLHLISNSNLQRQRRCAGYIAHGLSRCRSSVCL